MRSFFTHDPGELLSDYLRSMAAYRAGVRGTKNLSNDIGAPDQLSNGPSAVLEAMRHDLRSPLNAIVGFASMLKPENGMSLTAEKQGEYASYILQSADLLLGHLNTVLEIPAILEDRVQVTGEKFSIVALLDKSVATLSSHAQIKGITLELHDAEEDVFITADSDLMARAIDHLLRFSIRRSESGSKILLRATLNSSGNIEIALRDFGAGLDVNQTQQAIHALDMANGATAHNDGDTGYEIAIARTYIEKHGGQLHIKSKPGTGTLFTLMIPSFNNDISANVPSSPFAKTG